MVPLSQAAFYNIQDDYFYDLIFTAIVNVLTYSSYREFSYIAEIKLLSLRWFDDVNYHSLVLTLLISFAFPNVGLCHGVFRI